MDRVELIEAELRKGSKLLSKTRKSAGRRDAIIKTATRILNDKSYALATMSEIAATLDLRDATLYYYFSDKQALGFACHLHSLRRLEAVLSESEAGGGTGIVRAEKFIKGVLEDSSQHGPQLYLGDYSYLNPEQRAAVAAAVEGLQLRVEAFLQQGIRDGTIITCETQLVVQLLFGMLIWLAKWTPNVADLTVERLMSAITVFGFHGLESRWDALGTR